MAVYLFQIAIALVVIYCGATNHSRFLWFQTRTVYLLCLLWFSNLGKLSLDGLSLFHMMLAVLSHILVVSCHFICELADQDGLTHIPSSWRGPCSFPCDLSARKSGLLMQGWQHSKGTSLSVQALINPWFASHLLVSHWPEREPHGWAWSELCKGIGFGRHDPLNHACNNLLHLMFTLICSCWNPDLAVVRILMFITSLVFLFFQVHSRIIGLIPILFLSKVMRSC